MIAWPEMQCSVLVFFFSLWTLCLHAQTSPELNLFQDYVQRYNKPYINDTDTFQTRFLVFKESLRRHKWLNSYETENSGSAVYGVNTFSDLTPQEFKERYLSGLKRSNNRKGYPSKPPYSSSPLPQTFDWRDHGVIGKVWNQKQCGSCWAFATVETIGSRYAIQTGHLLELSAQQLISCDTGVELYGCKGGALEYAFGSVESESITIVNASTYPFESGDGKSHNCKGNLPKVGVQLLDFTYRENLRNETEMQYYLCTYSPLTVSVNARAWQDYDGGIIQHHCDGDPSEVDHAVQVIGYDMNGPVPYWIVRNTWGSDWGEGGYLRLKFGQNMCGMTDEVVYVTKVAGVGL